MPPEPTLETNCRLWLEKVHNDLRAAEVDLSVKPPLLEDALFHCQQAAEKAMKAFLTWHRRPFRKTHDLIELGMSCVELDPALEPLLRQVAVLTEYAWRYRYPGPPQELTIEEADEGLCLAKRCVEAILERLPPEVTVGLASFRP